MAPKYHLKSDNQSSVRGFQHFLSGSVAHIKQAPGVHVCLPEKRATRAAFPGAQGVKVDAETQDDASGRDCSRFASLGRGVLLTGLAAKSIVCTQTPSGV